MKKCFALVLALCMCLGAALAQDETTPGLSYPALALRMPAVMLTVDVPSEMDAMAGDEEAHDLGFRFNCFSDTFELDVWVQDSRDMDMAGYATFLMERVGYTTAVAERINGFDAMRLTTEAEPLDFTILLAPPDTQAPAAFYTLAFGCKGEADVKLAEEILGTLRVME